VQAHDAAVQAEDEGLPLADGQLLRAGWGHVVKFNFLLLLLLLLLLLSLSLAPSLFLSHTVRRGLYLAAAAAAALPVSTLICSFSSSMNCCSLSISMMRGMRRMRDVVEAIQAAFLKLQKSFLAPTVVEPATAAVCWMAC